jgi:hypothetical protein
MVTMRLVVRAEIIKIGDSRGICIPRLFPELAKLGDEVELEAPDDQITEWRQ